MRDEGVKPPPAPPKEGRRVEEGRNLPQPLRRRGELDERLGMRVIG